MICGTSIISLLCISTVFSINAAISVSPQNITALNQTLTIDSVNQEAKPLLPTLLEEPLPPQDVVPPGGGKNHSLTYDTLYERAVKHYLDNEWDQCVGYIEMAIEDYQWYTDTLTRCRRDCRGEAESATPLTTPRTTDQIFFETSIRSALCLLKCRGLHFGPRKHHIAPISVDGDFEIRKPYDYLQLCLFKLGRFQNAANAAVTVLARQPDHKIMANNLRQYIEEFSADQDLLVNLELQEYATEYVKGDRAHVDEDFQQSAQHMETALSLYWKALDDCRFMCEEPFDQGWFPDFVSSVANHYTYTFRCKRRCTSKLSNLYGEEIADFLPSIFNYLQYAYQKLNNIPAACAATENFLELLPTDAAMLRNKQFYQSEYQKMERYFTPSKEVISHAARERYEDDLLHFINTEFVFLEDEKTVDLQEPDQTSNKTLSLRETLSDMLSSVFAMKPLPADDSKGEL